MPGDLDSGGRCQGKGRGYLQVPSASEVPGGGERPGGGGGPLGIGDVFEVCDEDPPRAEDRVIGGGRHFQEIPPPAHGHGDDVRGGEDLVEALLGVVLRVQLRREVFTGPLAQPGVGLGTAQAHLVGEFFSQGGEFRILRFVEGDQLVVVAPEHAVEGVVVGRRNGVVFVIVATGAGDGEAQCAAGDDVDAVVDDVVGDAEEAPAAGDESQGGEVGGIGGNQLIGRQLQHQKSVVGQVGIEGMDDPVAVGGCVNEAGFFASVDVALGVGVAGDVEPMASPAFAVPGGVEQAVNESAGRAGAVAGGVGDEAVDVVGFGGKAGEVEAEASDEGAWVGRRGGVDSGGFEPG